MIGLRYQGQYLDLYDNTSLSVSARNPMFGASSIPGTRVYDFRLPLSPKNKRLIGNVHRLDDNASWPTFGGVGLHIGRGQQLWRIGRLRIKKANGKSGGQQECTASFHTDAGDVQAAIVDKDLSDLDLGRAVVAFQPELTYPDVNYAFFPVRNPDFYGGGSPPEGNPDYLGYVNYYHEGAFGSNTATNQHTLVPFPFLLYIVERIFKQLGYYGITGSWVSDPDIRRLVIYNTVAIDRVTNVINRYASSFYFADHMPAMSVGKFLVALQNMFCIGFFINPITRMVEIEPLSGISQDQAYQTLSDKANVAYEKGFRYEDGFYLSMSQDGGDALYKGAPITPYAYQVGAGGQPFKTEAGTLFEQTYQDTINIDRTWTTPVAAQAGNSPAFGLENNDFTLRLLFYLGLRSDSLGNAYPRGSAEADTLSLRYDTGKGLYNRYWKEWIGFLTNTVEVETVFHLGIKEFTALDWKQKIMRDHKKYFFSELNFTLSMAQGLEPVKATLYKSLL